MVPSSLKISVSLIVACLSFIRSRLRIKMISLYVLYIGVAVSAQNFKPSEYCRTTFRRGVSSFPLEESSFSIFPPGSASSLTLSLSDTSRRLCASSTINNFPLNSRRMISFFNLFCVSFDAEDGIPFNNRSTRFAKVVYPDIVYLRRMILATAFSIRSWSLSYSVLVSFI